MLVTVTCEGGSFVAFIYSLEMVWTPDRFHRFYWVSQLSLVGNAFWVPYALGLPLLLFIYLTPKNCWYGRQDILVHTLQYPR